jgi:hypothetical protein
MRTKFVDEVVHLNEEHVDVCSLFLSFVGIRTLDEDIQEVQEVDEDTVIHFLEFLLMVKVSWIQPPDSLSFQGTDDTVVTGDDSSKQTILSFNDRFGWIRKQSFSDIVIREEGNILRRWIRKCRDDGRSRSLCWLLKRLTWMHAIDYSERFGRRWRRMRCLEHS